MVRDERREKKRRAARAIESRAGTELVGSLGTLLSLGEGEEQGTVRGYVTQQ